jgi:hypothetical protein
MWYPSVLAALTRRTGRSRAGRLHRPSTPRGPAPQRRSFRPRLERLEERTVPTTVTSNLDDGSSGTLRAVIDAASPGDTIDFDPSLAGQTITSTRTGARAARARASC